MGLKGLLAATSLALTLTACRASLKLAPDDSSTVLSHHVIDAPDPSRPGPHAVRTLYYGSGTDTRRPEYRDSVAIITETVDASTLVDLGGQADERNGYWGFSPDSFPINARVWYPEGDGPFPLALIVHGNHDMKDFSDPGYGYLGELLASRGIILASVDMNFINGGIRNENDGRGWLLLEHLQAWREFNAAADGPLSGRVDLGRVALIGHSRGGEAVGHAAAFNRLDRYPDDANFEFDFGFGIRSIIAIAPVDGQYRPTDRLVPVHNVNYLVFHGSHDGDVTSFHGIRQYRRVELTEPGLFKSAVYVYRANHGQWNSVWGPRDNGPRSDRILDLRGLLDEEDQRQFARVYVSAFLEATLHDDRRYLPLFRDHRVAGGWLPKTMYVTEFQDASFQPVVTFEEDIDVTTGSLAGVTLTADSLATWREADLKLRSSNRPTTSSSQDNQVVWLGWNNRIAGPDTARVGRPASYAVQLTDRARTVLDIGPASTLEFLLGPIDDVPGPRRGGDADSVDVEGSRADDPRAAENDEDEKEPIDLSIELVDASGARASLPLSRYGVPRRPLETRVLRRSDLEEDRFASLSEVVMQSYSIPLGDFAAVNPALSLGTLLEVRFVFDRVDAGTVVMDDVGFSNLDPAFLSAKLPG